MPNEIPKLVENGGYLHSPNQQNVERVWDDLDDETIAVISKLTEKKIITGVVLVEDETSLDRENMYNRASELDRIVRGSARLIQSTHEVRMYYTGYSPDSHHDSYTMNEREAYKSVRVGKIAEHKLIALRRAVEWSGDPGQTLNW